MTAEVILAADIGADVCVGCGVGYTAEQLEVLGAGSRGRKGWFICSERLSMTLKQLNDEQIRTWTLEEKDRWWFQNIYRGNMPQLTLRAAATGFLLGGVLSATNLYIGAKTGWSLGVGITSVILAYALWKVLEGLGLCREFTVLENNAMQSIATSAGYMTAPLISSLTAYMIVADRMLPWHQIMIWNIVLSILGVLFAFPMKRRFINDEQHPFPEGRAAAVVMDTLHHADAAVGLVKAKAMALAAGGSAFFKFIQAESIQGMLQKLFIAKEKVIHFPETLADLLRYLGIDVSRWSLGASPSGQPIGLRDLTVDFPFDLAMFGAGGLMGIRAGVSLMIGAVVNYLILAPLMISAGEIQASPSGGYGLRQIALWALWPGVAAMVIASFVSFLAKPQVLLQSITGLFQKRESSDVLRGIEFPLWVSAVGIPIFSLLAAYLAKLYFGVEMWVSLVGLPLTFLLCLVAANSTALTSITPVGATSKITQLFYGVVRPGEIHTNLATAGLTAEVVSNSSNLLMDIKPGYMLGAKPRQQAIGHVIGIFAGAMASVPLFYILFARDVPTEGIASLQSEKFPMPSVTVWKAVAEVLTKGIDQLPPSVRFAVGVAVLVGLTMEVARIVTRGRFPLSAVAMGLAFVIDFGSSATMFLGSAFFWAMGVGRHVIPETAETFASSESKQNWFVAHHEPICAGLIAGTALMGILDAIAAAIGN